MGAPAAGQVVVIPFPFSDLSMHKFRPALLLSDVGRGDWIACQITSNPYSDPHAVELAENDFLSGGLKRTSYARPGKLFTASTDLFASFPGQVNAGKRSEVVDKVVTLLRISTSTQ